MDILSWENYKYGMGIYPTGQWSFVRFRGVYRTTNGEPLKWRKPYIDDSYFTFTEGDAIYETKTAIKKRGKSNPVSLFNVGMARICVVKDNPKQTIYEMWCKYDFSEN